MTTATAPPLRLGVTGTGWIAQNHALPAVGQCGAFTLTGVHDPDADAAARTAEVFSARVYRSVDALLEDVDALYVASPTAAHAEAVMAALDAGVHVLCEKPLGRDVEDAMRMISLADKTGVQLATAFNQRFHQAHLALRAALRDGVVGKICAVRSTYCCWLPLAEAGWRGDLAQGGGGALLDLAPHGIDLAEFVTGQRLVELTAQKARSVFGYPSDDSVAIVGLFDEGGLFTHHVSYNWSDNFPRRTLEIVGVLGMIRAENTLGQTGGGTVVIRGARHVRWRSFPVPDIGRSPFRGLFEGFAELILHRERGCFRVDESRVVSQLASLLARGSWRQPAVP